MRDEIGRQCCHPGAQTIQGAQIPCHIQQGMSLADLGLESEDRQTEAPEVAPELQGSGMGHP